MGDVRIAVIGCGHAARIHVTRLSTIPGVRIVGCSDRDGSIARSFADQIPRGSGTEPIPSFDDHHELIRQVSADAAAIFTPHLFHYRPLMDALQAGWHVFVEKPLTTNVQEVVDIVNVARARERQVAVGYQFRLLPSLIEARKQLAEGVIGPVRLVSAVLALSWLTAHSGPEHAWRYEPKATGGGILADSGDALIDALVWSVGQAAVEVAAIQSRLEAGGIDLVTAATIRLADGTPANFGLSGNSPGFFFRLAYFGEEGRIRVTEDRLIREIRGGPAEEVPLPAPTESIDGNFVAAIRDGTAPCCPASEALDTVRLLEAIGRSAAIGQVVKLG